MGSSGQEQVFTLQDEQDSGSVGTLRRDRTELITTGPSGDSRPMQHGHCVMEDNVISPRVLNMPGPGVVEPRVRLPVFDGKGDWEPFWVQFQFLISRYGWDSECKLSHLVCCLSGTAMDYVARLPVCIRSDLRSLSQRFGDHVLPETYRATLQTLKKAPKEDFHEYAARVQGLMGKAYPGLEGTELFVNLTIIEYVVNGIAEEDLAYDVLTKKN